MVRRALASSSVLLAVLANVGCGPAAATDAGVFVITEDPPVSGISLAYVIRAITIPDGTSEVTPGFDLDGRVSDGTSTATCEDRHADSVNGMGQLGVDRSGLTDGQLGGRLVVAELIEAAEADDREAIRDILAEHADLQPSDADVLACTSISAGIGFTAVLGTVD
ncbi:MAG: hypothetical protein J0L92_14605 [Deltaproteobacteria bacterium]|nr:hypothetical protein [Deltaproteobacteria bacterium]